VPGFFRRCQRLAELRGAGGQQGHGLGDVPPGGRGADADPGGQFAESLAFAQIGQHQESLSGGVELAPGRADLPVVTADDASDVGEGPGRQRQRGMAEKHGSPLVADADLGRSLHLPGLPHVPSRHAGPDQDIRQATPRSG
jgi:hypothetical protein